MQKQKNTFILSCLEFILTQITIVIADAPCEWALILLIYQQPKGEKTRRRKMNILLAHVHNKHSAQGNSKNTFTCTLCFICILSTIIVPFLGSRIHTHSLFCAHISNQKSIRQPGLAHQRGRPTRIERNPPGLLSLIVPIPPFSG